MSAVVRGYAGVAPRVGSRVFLAETAVVVGDVELGDDSSVWFGSVLRGDVGYIRIGARSNIQDASVVHMTTELSNTVIEEDVTVGHGVIVHGARIQSGALIGMGSILLDNVVVGEQSWIGAGSLVPAGAVIPPRCLAFGRPARVIRELVPSEYDEGRMLAARYVGLAARHRNEQR